MRARMLVCALVRTQALSLHYWHRTSTLGSGKWSGKGKSLWVWGGPHGGRAAGAWAAGMGYERGGGRLP